MTDTADMADIVLPATSQLEQVDLHKAYGHTILSYNHQAIPPLGEAKSNWEVMGLLAREMGFSDPWLQQSVDEVIEETLTASALSNPALQGITLERLKRENSIPLQFAEEVPFANFQFPTPSGKVELYSATLASQGIDPLPDWVDQEDDGYTGGEEQNDRLPVEDSFILISGAAHHFVSSSLANHPALLNREGEPFVEIHPQDAKRRGVNNGDQVIIENGRGWCQLQALLTENVRPGVLASPKGRWSKQGNGRNVNWTTPDTLGDMAGQSTYHSNRVWLRKVVS